MEESCVASAQNAGATPNSLVSRLLERIRSLEHYSVSPPDSPDTDTFSRLTTLVKRAQTGLDTGLAYILGSEEAERDREFRLEAEEMREDMEGRLAAAKRQIEDDAMQLLQLTKELETAKHTAEMERARMSADHAQLEQDVEQRINEAVNSAILQKTVEMTKGLEAALQAASSERLATCAVLEEQLEMLHSRLADAEARTAQASQEAESSRGLAAQMASEVETLKQSRAALTQELNETRVKLERAIAAADDFHARFLQERTERRKVHEELQSLRGNIRVLCRIRPAQSSSCLEVPFQGTVRLSTAERRLHEFEFNAVASEDVSQEALFEEVSPLVRSAADGFNVCILAYGQTGSGKTHTMSGPTQDPGLGVRAVSMLCALSKDAEKRELSVGMLEIYNDLVRDLLSGGPALLEVSGLSPSQLADPRDRVPGLTWRPVRSAEDVLGVLAEGNAARATAATALNAASSRSHAILSIHIRDPSGKVPSSLLHLVDLAGSERVGRSEATGPQLKEAQAINKSLSALGDVIAALQAGQAHVPFRNSRLTQVLQCALSGSSKVMLVCCLSPELESASETLSSLGFASRAAKVELGRADNAVGTPGTGKALHRTPGARSAVGTPGSVGITPLKKEKKTSGTPLARTPLQDVANRSSIG